MIEDAILDYLEDNPGTEQWLVVQKIGEEYDVPAYKVVEMIEQLQRDGRIEARDDADLRGMRHVQRRAVH